MFYVPFYTIFSIFGNYPIKKMPQCQFLFSAVFVFQKSCTRNILRIAWDKLPALLNHVTKTVSEGDLRGAARWPDPTQARPNPGPLLGGVWAHQGAPDSASSPIYSSFRENPRHTRENPRKVPQPPSSPKQDSGDRSLCSGTLPERGIAPGVHRHRLHRHLHRLC